MDTKDLDSENSRQGVVGTGNKKAEEVGVEEIEELEEAPMKTERVQAIGNREARTGDLRGETERGFWSPSILKKE